MKRSWLATLVVLTVGFGFLMVGCAKKEPMDGSLTISYGKEKPLDPGNNEEAWAKNRRDHFVITNNKE